MPVVKSVARTLETLSLFDDLRRPVSIIEVAKYLGYPHSSTAALLKSMVAMGFLTYNETSRTYSFTNRVPMIGSWMSPVLYRGAPLMDLVDAVVDRTRCLVLIGAMNGDHVIYYHVSSPDNVDANVARAGTRHPLGKSAVGHVLLSTMDDDDIRRMYRRINAYRGADEDPVDICELLDSVREFRRQRYLISTDRIVDGAGLIAMMLPEGCSDQPLCIGLGAPSNVIRERGHELVSELQKEVDAHFGNVVPVSANRNVKTWAVSNRGKIRAAGLR